MLVSDEEKKLEKIFFTTANRISIVFSGTITATFYGTMYFFGKKENAFTQIISPKTRLEFSVEKRLYKSDISLQITKMSGELADIVDKKIHKLAMICDKKRKKEGKKIDRTRSD